MGGSFVEAEADDSVESIAFRHGHLPETLWTHPENAALRAQRESMHVLAKGDRVFVPERQPRSVECATDRVHHFRRRGVPSSLCLKLAAGGQRLADRPCRIEIAGRAPFETRTDPQGAVKLPVMPDAAGGRIVVELGDGRSLAFALGPRELHPVDTLRGAQARLRNLGYLEEAAEGAMDLPTALATARFQEDHGLERSGALDDATKAALLEAHGG